MKTWTDPVTGLEWQINPPMRLVNWTEAKVYAAKLDLDGGGWRLPTKEELVTVSGGRVPTLHGKGWFWASSPMKDNDYAWYVYFDYDDIGGYAGVGYDGHVRCVRQWRSETVGSGPSQSKKP